MKVYVPILIALLSGLLLPLFHFKSRKMRSIYVEVCTVLTSVCAFILIFSNPEPVTVFYMTDDLALRLKVDGLSKVFMGLSAFLWPFATLYAFEYMAHEKNENKFFTFYTLSYAVTLLIAMSANLFTLYVFYECLTLVTLPLVTHKKDAQSAFAGRRYLAYSIGGASLGFIGLIFALTFSGALDFNLGGILNAQAVVGNENLLRVAFVLSFIGFSAKAAIYPLSHWLPIASVAPTPVTALLHAVAVVKAGAFAAMRLTFYTFNTDILYGSWAQTVVLVLTAFTIIYGAVMAVKEQHLKRRLAYSTVSNLSYVLFGVALMTSAGFVGAMTHMVFHGIMKITLFYCAGAILVKTNKEYIQDLRGFYHVMPYTSVVFTLASIAMVGIPPFAGFISKFNLLSAATQVPTAASYFGMVALITSSVLSAIYLLYPACTFLFMKVDQKNEHLVGKKLDPSFKMKLPLFVLSVAIVLLGMFSVPLVDFFTKVASGL